jgi:hypothetical protein
MDKSKAGALACVSWRIIRGEVYFGCAVLLDGRPVFKVEERESLQTVRLEVLDWSRRQGKSLAWEYPQSHSLVTSSPI